MCVKAVRILVVVLALSATFTSAEEETIPKSGASERKTGGDKKKTNIDFEDELVEGELKKPELFYLLQKKQFNFKRLIKLREDFLPEMRRDGDELKRGRNKN